MGYNGLLDHNGRVSNFLWLCSSLWLAHRMQALKMGRVQNPKRSPVIVMDHRAVMQRKATAVATAVVVVRTDQQQ